MFHSFHTFCHKIFSQRCKKNRGGNDTLFFPSAALIVTWDCVIWMYGFVAISYVDTNSHIVTPDSDIKLLTASETCFIYGISMPSKQERNVYIAFHFYSIINHNKASRSKDCYINIYYRIYVIYVLKI